MIAQLPSKLISVRELARALQVSQTWLRTEAQAGRLPSLRANGTNVVFSRVAVEAALAKRAAEPIKAER